MNIENMKLPHYVYLMRGTGTNYFKIGMSRDVLRRKRMYSVPFDLEVVKSFQARDYWQALDIEKRVQTLYRNHRCRGEWFTGLSPEHFIGDLEWLALGDSTRAEQEYLSRGERYDEMREKPVVTRASTRHDRRVLETLREDGIEAAMELREELNGN